MEALVGGWRHATRPWLLDCSTSDGGTYASSCHSIGLYTRLLGDLALEEQCVEDQHLAPPLASLGLCRPEAARGTACNTTDMSSSTNDNSTNFWSQLLKMLLLWPAVAIAFTFAFGLHRRRARWWAGPHLPGFLGHGDGSVAPTAAEKVLEWFGLYSAEPDLYHHPGAPVRIPTRIPLQLVKEGFRGRSDDPHCRSASDTKQQNSSGRRSLAQTITSALQSSHKSLPCDAYSSPEPSWSTPWVKIQAAVHPARERKRRTKENVSGTTPITSEISLPPAPSPPPSPPLPVASPKRALPFLYAFLRPWVTVFYPCGKRCHMSPIIESASLLGALISSILIILFRFEAVVSADDYTNNTAILRPSHHLPLGRLIERLFRDEAGVLHTAGNFFESEMQATLMQFYAIVPPMLAVAYIVFLWTLIAAGSNIGRTEHTGSRSFLVRQLISTLVTVAYLVALVRDSAETVGPLYSAWIEMDNESTTKKPLCMLVASLYTAHGAALCACLFDYSRLFLFVMFCKVRQAARESIFRTVSIRKFTNPFSRMLRLQIHSRGSPTFSTRISIRIAASRISTRIVTFSRRALPAAGSSQLFANSLHRVRMEVGLPIELIAASLASFVINLSIVIALCFWMQQFSEDLAQVCAGFAN